jgi:hypothetical protein
MMGPEAVWHENCSYKLVVQVTVNGERANMRYGIGFVIIAGLMVFHIYHISGQEVQIPEVTDVSDNHFMVQATIGGLPSLTRTEPTLPAAPGPRPQVTDTPPPTETPQPTAGAIVSNFTPPDLNPPEMIPPDDRYQNEEDGEDKAPIGVPPMYGAPAVPQMPRPPMPQIQQADGSEDSNAGQLADPMQANQVEGGDTAGAVYNGE